MAKNYVVLYLKLYTRVSQKVPGVNFNCKNNSMCNQMHLRYLESIHFLSKDINFITNLISILELFD